PSCAPACRTAATSGGARSGPAGRCNGRSVSCRPPFRVFYGDRDEFLRARGVAEIAFGGAGGGRFAAAPGRREGTAAERALLRRAAQGVARPREHLFLRRAYLGRKP